MIEYNEAIHKYLNSLNTISKKNVELLLRQSKIIHIKANTAIVDFEDKPEYIYMLIKGVVRSFILLESGKEVTKTLFTPIDLFSSFIDSEGKLKDEFTEDGLHLNGKAY